MSFITLQIVKNETYQGIYTLLRNQAARSARDVKIRKVESSTFLCAKGRCRKPSMEILLKPSQVWLVKNKLALYSISKSNPTPLSNPYQMLRLMFTGGQPKSKQPHQPIYRLGVSGSSARQKKNPNFQGKTDNNKKVNADRRPEKQKLTDALRQRDCYR